MDVGTAEIIDEIEPIKRLRPGRLGESGSGGNGGGRNPGGSGGDGPDDESRADIQPFVPEKSRILTAFLLLVVMMTFGGLMAAYVVIATNNAAEWRPFDLPVQLWISTALIFFSSLVYHLGKNAVDRNGARRWLHEVDRLASRNVEALPVE